MEDLLREEDFLKKPYNPWRRFLLFYGIEIALTILLIKLAKYLPVATIIFLVCLPILLASIMIFYKKAYLLINDKLVIRSVGGIFLLYCLGLGVLTVKSIGTKHTSVMIIGLIILIIIYIIALLIIIAISREERRNVYKASTQKMKDS